MSATYGVQLWDHDPADDGSQEGQFCGELARRHLDGPNTGLSWRQIGRAIRHLQDHGWSDVSMYVWRED